MIDVQALLGDAERRADLLIEFLHLIQDEYGHLSAAHLRALAEELKLSKQKCSRWPRSMPILMW